MKSLYGILAGAGEVLLLAAGAALMVLATRAAI
jgi:hypothetical protein